MKKLTSVFIKLVLIFFASSPLVTMAGKSHDYHGDLIIHNNTPFTLAIIDDYMAIKHGQEKGEFVFDDHFQKDQGLRILPGDEYYVGHGKSYDDTIEVEGYLTFKILHTNKTFVAHYRFAEVWNTQDSWVKLEQPENGQPYPGISIDISQVSNFEKEGLFSPTIHHQHRFAVSFTTSDSDAVCIMDPDCTFHYLNLPLTIYDYHSPYLPTHKEKLNASLMKLEADDL